LGSLQYFKIECISIDSSFKHKGKGSTSQTFPSYTLEIHACCKRLKNVSVIEAQPKFHSSKDALPFAFSFGSILPQSRKILRMDIYLKV